MQASVQRTITALQSRICCQQSEPRWVGAAGAANTFDAVRHVGAHDPSRRSCESIMRREAIYVGSFPKGSDVIRYIASRFTRARGLVPPELQYQLMRCTRLQVVEVSFRFSTWSRLLSSCTSAGRPLPSRAWLQLGHMMLWSLPGQFALKLLGSACRAWFSFC